MVHHLIGLMIVCVSTLCQCSLLERYSYIWFWCMLMLAIGLGSTCWSSVPTTLPLTLARVSVHYCHLRIDRLLYMYMTLQEVCRSWLHGSDHEIKICVYVFNCNISWLAFCKGRGEWELAGFMPPITDTHTLCTEWLPQPYGTCMDTLLLIHCMQNAEYMCSSDIPYMGNIT